MATVTICSDFGVQENNIRHCFYIFPNLFAMKWWDQMPWSWFFFFLLVCLFVLSFKPAFSLSFTFIKRLFSSSLPSDIKVISSAHMRLFIFLPEISIPASDSSSLAFHMMYSAYKLNKQGSNVQPWYTPFPIWNQSVVPCLVLTAVYWPATVAYWPASFSGGR